MPALGQIDLGPQSRRIGRHRHREVSFPSLLGVRIVLRVGNKDVREKEFLPRLERAKSPDAPRDSIAWVKPQPSGVSIYAIASVFSVMTINSCFTASSAEYRGAM